MIDQALLLFHGRGSDGADMQGLARYLSLPSTTLLVTPTAKNNQWYPNKFNVAMKLNQPELTESLKVIDDWMTKLKRDCGLDFKRIIMAGFSQGASLVSRYVATHPQHYGGVGIFSGGMIGSEDEIATVNFNGEMTETRVFIGCDKNDPYIPIERVELTAKIFAKLKAKVDLRIYQALGHSIHPDEIVFLQQVLK